MAQFSVLRSLARIFALLIFVLLVLFVGSLFFATHFVTGTIGYVVSNLAARSGVSLFLMRAIVIFATIPFFWAVGCFGRNVLGLFSLGWNPLAFYRSPYGLIVVAYVGCFSYAMYWTSRDAYAYKYCADTPEQVFVSDSPGKDPVYGVELKPCSLMQIEELRNGNGKLQAPRELDAANAASFGWFDGLTGKPRVWIAASADGRYKFFDRPGSSPETGQVLQPVNQDIVQRVIQLESADEATKRQALKTRTAVEVRDKEREVAILAKRTEASGLQAVLSQAQAQFDAKDYEDAKKTCDNVLSSERSNVSCLTIRERSSTKLAQKLVIQAQSQIEHGEFDEAIWSAADAHNLDPNNVNALKLKALAVQMKPRTGN